MKQIVVIAATAAEIAPFVLFLKKNYDHVNHNVFRNENWIIHILISGVGMMATAFALGTHFSSHKYEAALQVGIAGSFDAAIALGSVVAVASDQYGDLGAEDNGQYIDLFDLGFLDKNDLPFTDGKLWNREPCFNTENLISVSALSVNTVSGQTNTIQARKALHSVQIESMEGVAFHYACLQNKIPFLQIRSISNYVTPRNKADWNIKLAIENLNNYLQDTFAQNNQ